ncbi:hypothetical protein C7E19_24665, partial [Stenotrophomonas maltophilia]
HWSWHGPGTRPSSRIASGLAALGNPVLAARAAEIFKAQAALLDDTDLITRTCQLMVEGHWSWHGPGTRPSSRIASGLAALGNPVLAARAA